MELYENTILKLILACRPIPFSVPFPGDHYDIRYCTEELNNYFREHNVTIEVTIDEIQVTAKKKKLRQLFVESYPDHVDQEKKPKSECKEIEDEINAKLDAKDTKLPFWFVMKTQTYCRDTIKRLEGSIIDSVLKGRESPGYKLNIEFRYYPLTVDVSIKKE